MYNDTRMYENVEEFNLKIELDKNTTISFFIATPIVLFLIYLLVFIKDIDPEARAVKYNLVPVELLNFGHGDGTGKSKGNLAVEGAAHKGRNPSSNLHDAETATASRKKTATTNADINTSNNIKTVSDIGAGKKAKNNGGVSTKNVGIKNGATDGTGLGNFGRGRGLGEGFGDIEWGGGGSRFVLSKKPPRYPKGVNTSADIKIKFTVLKDGTVASMIPLKKADPALERAAMDALRQWRFNPIDEDIEMVGIIPFRFRLR